LYTHIQTGICENEYSPRVLFGSYSSFTRSSFPSRLMESEQERVLPQDLYTPSTSLAPNGPNSIGQRPRAGFLL
jgi:hypothetical protein